MRHARTVAAHVHVHQRIPDAVFLVAIGPDHFALLAQACFIDPGRRAEFAAHPVRTPGSGLQHFEVRVGQQRQHLVHPAVGADIGAPGVLAHGLLRPDDTPAAVGLRAFEVGPAELGLHVGQRRARRDLGQVGAGRQGQQGARRQGDAGRFVMKCHILLPRRRKGAPGAPVGQFYRISYNRRALSRHPFRMMPNRAGGSGGGPGQEPGSTSLCRQQ